MLSSFVICPDRDMAQRLKSALATLSDISVGETFDSYPAAIDLTRMLRVEAPDIVFLSFESIETATLVLKVLQEEGDGVRVIAILDSSDTSILREIMRTGVREFVTNPFERRTLAESLGRVKAQLELDPPIYEATGQIFSFLPSKAGVGASTLALNVSAALARRPETRVLLSDFDLTSGMMRFMLKLENEYSVINAVERSRDLDENLWPTLVTSFDKLDVLHAGRINPNLRIETPQVRRLIEFMRRNYQVLCFDLSGNLELYSLEIMRESKRVLMVCTPEEASLLQAREKLHFLKSLALESRVSVVLNRCQKKAMFTKEQVEEFLGMPVLAIFPNDYNRVHKAAMAATFIELKSDLGKSMEQFARDLIERRSAPQAEKSKFLEHSAFQPKPLILGQNL